MVSPPVVLPQIVSVGFVCDLLLSTSHNGFPVVAHRSDSSQDPLLVGMILRSHLLTLLKARTFYTQMDTPDGPILDLASDANVPHVLDFAPSLSSKSDALVQDLNSVGLRPGDRDAFLDLRPWMNRAPFRALSSTPAHRVYRLFRSMGLRHLCVVNDSNDCLGIITRKDVRTDFRVDLS